MKFNYVVPEIEVINISPAKCLMASGENLRSRVYGSETEESTDNFWD